MTPHTIDPGFEHEENTHLSPLAELGNGTGAEIVRLAEHDGDLLHFFYDSGLIPGRSVRVVRKDPAAGQLTVALDGEEQPLGLKAAQGLFVRPL